MGKKKLKKQLCDILIAIKDYDCLTYDNIIDLSDGYIHRSQLINIIKNEGKGVASDTIHTLLDKIGVEVEVRGYIREEV